MLEDDTGVPAAILVEKLRICRIHKKILPESRCHKIMSYESVEKLEINIDLGKSSRRYLS